MNRKLLFAYILGLCLAQPTAAFAASQVAAPSGTSAVALSENRVNVSWRDNSSNESSFELYRSASGVNGMFTLVTRAAPGATAHGDVGLNPSTQYCYKVRAVATLGGRARYSQFSNTACATTAAPPTLPGSIRITTTTAGFDVDVNGYLFAVDGVAGHLIGTNAAVTVPDLAAGGHTVTLYGLASNCSVEGPNPRGVSVEGGATTEVGFAVTCGSGPTVELTTLTTGSNIDTDGYGVMLWRRVAGGRILAGGGTVPANGSVRFFGVETGEYDFEITGTAANCMQVNSLPMVDLTSGGTLSFALNVSCAPIAGGVEVCDNGLDDDGDGLIDSLDPDCQLVCAVEECFSGPNCPPGYICGFDGCCTPHCFDGFQNGSEGDVDCGADCPTKCAPGQHCYGFWDCASGVCVNGVCQ